MRRRAYVVKTTRLSLCGRSLGAALPCEGTRRKSWWGVSGGGTGWGRGFDGGDWMVKRSTMGEERGRCQRTKIDRRWGRGLVRYFISGVPLNNVPYLFL